MDDQQRHICSAAEDVLVWIEVDDDDSLTGRWGVQHARWLQPYFMIVTSALNWRTV